MNGKNILGKSKLSKKLLCLIVIAVVCVVTLVVAVVSNNENSEDEYVVKYEVGIEVKRVENLIFSRYDIDVEIDGKYKGTIENGESDIFVLDLEEGFHTIEIFNADDFEVSGKTMFQVTQDEQFYFDANCYNSEIVIKNSSDDIEQTTNTEDWHEEFSNMLTTEENNLTMEHDESFFLGKDYEYVENELKKIGFSDITFSEVEESDYDYEEGQVCRIEINGSSFKKGDTFKKDAKIYVEYIEEKPVESTLFYSTNTREKAIEGKEGVFAYVKKGGSYDLYWIIDLDNGYVYDFSDGNGETTCDRLKIESGDLNSNLKITYHDGADVWSYNLHFKYTYAPETLVMVDQNGFDWYYETTDLQDALALRDTKNIRDY